MTDQSNPGFAELKVSRILLFAEADVFEVAFYNSWVDFWS
jgi:hypothetical protein